MMVPVVIAFTPNYFVPAATCLQSLIRCANEKDKYHIICLLTEDLPETYREKLFRLDALKRLHFTFLTLQDELKDAYIDEKYTVAASYRLLLPDLLPQFDKIIYVDCDIILRTNLAELFYSVDVKDHYFAAVYEAALDFQEEHIRSIGCEPGWYINSGFLVMNLQQLRKDNMTEKFVQALHADYLEFPDQDVLNMLCKGKIIGLPPYYNSIRTFFLPQYKKDFLKRYTEKDWEAVHRKGNIHYTGGKPWNQYAVRFTDWWDMYETLPAEIKEAWNIKKKLYLFYRIYKTAIGKFVIRNLQKWYRRMK
jgi:lipopolysaccharide biosynthesis glycosyltransferase